MISGSTPVMHWLLYLDIARAITLCGMIVFHAVKHMEFFGLIAAETNLTGSGAIFARCIAATFLFLAGMNLVLARTEGLRAKSWACRLAMISVAVCLVILATYLALPSHDIFFGIFHAIAVASLVGLAFICAPA